MDKDIEPGRFYHMMCFHVSSQVYVCFLALSGGYNHAGTIPDSEGQTSHTSGDGW